MRTISIVLLSGLAAACSDEADIGVDSTPMTCEPNGAVADVSGTVRNSDGAFFDFNSATPSVRTSTGGPTLSLDGSELILRFGFYCGQAERERYGVRGDTQDGLDCPLEVASAILGQIEYLPAKSGTMIIDENSNCLAGRFHVDFGSSGSIDGAFSTPWQ